MISPQQEHSLYISTVRKERKTAMAQLQDILLVTDIDGTLLHDKAGLSAGNLEAITLLYSKGRQLCRGHRPRLRLCPALY